MLSDGSQRRDWRPLGLSNLSPLRGYTPEVSRPLFIFLTFVAGSLAGCVLLIVLAVLLGVITIALYQRAHPGIGAVAGGLSEISVALVPVLSGIIAILLARQSRSSAQSN
jgi:hypothetical protein